MLNIRCLFCTSGTTLMCALSVASAAHGQASTTACFLHVYNATTANNKTALSAAVDGFNNAACSTKLRPIASTSPLSNAFGRSIKEHVRLRSSRPEKTTVSAASRRIRSLFRSRPPMAALYSPRFQLPPLVVNSLKNWRNRGSQLSGKAR